MCLQPRLDPPEGMLRLAGAIRLAPVGRDGTMSGDCDRSDEAKSVFFLNYLLIYLCHSASGGESAQRFNVSATGGAVAATRSQRPSAS